MPHYITRTLTSDREHLYRRHLLPPQCHRCCSVFQNDVALRDHQRDLRGCEIREQLPPEGFDKEQERRLKSKKRSQVFQSEEDKWKGVYRILFPDDDDANMPSPYIEYQPCTGQTTEATSVARFQEFSRLELPRMVRRTLEAVVEQEAQPLEDKLKEQLVDIVKQCQAQLESMFQGTSSKSPSDPPPNAVPTTTKAHRRQISVHAKPEAQAIVFGATDLNAQQDPLSPSIARNYLTVPRPPANASSSSSDSGYDSNWLSAAMPQHFDLSTTTQYANPSFQVISYDTNAYLHLNSFIDPFNSVPEQQHSLEVPTSQTAQDPSVLPSTEWSFMQTLPGQDDGLSVLAPLEEGAAPCWEM